VRQLRKELATIAPCVEVMFDSTVVRAHVLGLHRAVRKLKLQARPTTMREDPANFPSNVAITAGFILIKSVQTASRL
jgi:hypothetical protein